MQIDRTKNQHEQALKLAESGDYKQALKLILKHLEVCSNDGTALNDAGSILFCLQRGKEAIAYFERALAHCTDDEKTQVFWNLCEAYIHEKFPVKAGALFNLMQQRQILNPDIVNRTAQAFLETNNLGQAMETLSLSLQLWPEQDVLKPMLEVIRDQRKQVAVIAGENSLFTQMLISSLELKIPVKSIVGKDISAESIQDSDILVFVGISNSLIQPTQSHQKHRTLLVLQERDIYHPCLGRIDLAAIDTVIACAPSAAIDDLREQIGSITVYTAEAAPDISGGTNDTKNKGKRIAAIGPWTSRNNPMFLLQCFQKLHYIDSSYRLYLAGWFEDKGLERYMNTMIESMDLENEVILDTSVKNIKKWLQDKHYIVSTAVDSGALGGVWLGAGCGLKPVVHRFAGAQESVDPKFIFDLAEDFCEQILEPSFNPLQYRQIAQQRFEQMGLSKQVHWFVSDLEKQMREASLQTTKASKSIREIPQKACVAETAKKSLIDFNNLVEIPRAQELTNV